jgi:hypothetical protein
MINHNTLRRAVITAEMAIALGAPAVASAQTEANPVRGVPEGVVSLTSEKAIQQEAFTAFAKLHERWNGVVILHAPKKKVPVGARGQTRDYLVVYDSETSQPAYLDIAWAEELGAIDTYAIKGTHAEAVKFDPSKHIADMPTAQSVGLNQKFNFVSDPKDPSKTIQVAPSSVVPHA